MNINLIINSNISFAIISLTIVASLLLAFRIIRKQNQIRLIGDCHAMASILKKYAYIYESLDKTKTPLLFSPSEYEAMLTDIKDLIYLLRVASSLNKAEMETLLFMKNKMHDTIEVVDKSRQITRNLTGAKPNSDSIIDDLKVARKESLLMLQKIISHKPRKIKTEPGFLNGEIVATSKTLDGLDVEAVRWDIETRDWVSAPDLSLADVAFKPVLDGNLLSTEELRHYGIH